MTQILYGVIGFCKIIFGFLLFFRMFPEKRWNQRWTEGAGWCVLIGLAISQAWDSRSGFIPWLQIFLNGIINAAIIKIFYRCRFLDVWIWNWLYDIGYSLLKIPFIIARGIYLDKGIFYLNVNGGRVLSECILCLFQLGIICFFYFKCQEQVEFLLKELLKSRRRRFLSLLTEMIILLGIHWLMGLGIGQYDSIDMVVGILFISVITVAFVLYVILTMYTYSRMEQKNLSVQKEMLAKENGIITQYCRQDAKRLHDLKHTWIYLQNCLEEKNWGNAMECVCKHLEEVKRQQRYIKTGIPEIDLLLDYKCHKMEKEGIHFSADIEVDSLPGSVSGEDYMIIWGNLLDNAIEASQKCEAEEREIHLEIKSVNEMFLLKIWNTCLEQPRKMKRNWLMTTKKDSICHGWGMANVKQIVESAGGEIDYTCGGNWFQVNVLI